VNHYHYEETSMKQVLILLFLLSDLFAGIPLNFSSFEADFVQQINDESKKIVKYYGKVYAKKPKTALWKYIKPIKKDVYINDNAVVIVEPELEQVILRRIAGDFDIFSLLKRAKKVGKNKYEARYKKTLFTLYFDGKNIQKLIYKDSFENLVTIIFSNQKYNTKFDKTIFEPKYPKDYDLILE